MKSIVLRAALGLATALAALGPGAPAAAEPPARLTAPVTDQAGVLGTDRAGVEAALTRLADDTGVRLSVAFVNSFDGLPAQTWTDRTAELTGQGALLAVATREHTYAYAFPAAPVPDATVAAVARRDLEPDLADNDWANAAIAFANGYRDAAAGDSGPPAWAFVLLLAGLIVVVLGALLTLTVRRRRA